MGRNGSEEVVITRSFKVIAATAVAVLLVLGGGPLWANGGDGGGTGGGAGGTLGQDGEDATSGSNGGGGGGGAGNTAGGQGDGNSGDGGAGGDHSYHGGAIGFPTTNLTGQDGEVGESATATPGNGGGGGAGGYGALLTGSGSIAVGAGQSIIGGAGGHGGGASGGSGGEGGDGGNGVSFGGDLTNMGIVSGGTGGGSIMGGAGGEGGSGVDLLDGDLINLDAATITGGNGGFGDGRPGGVGGVGVILSNGDLSNDGSIIGGNGGSGVSSGGRGGIGVSHTGGFLTNRGTITGGSGGEASNGTSGDGGHGVVFSDGSLFNSGSITGGSGGPTSSILGAETGDGGNGVILNNGTLTNTGTISGGNSGDSNYPSSGQGGTAVTGSDLTIINSGTILGGIDGNGGSPIDAIEFGTGANRLELWAGSVIEGQVLATTGTDDTFALGGANDATFDLNQHDDGTNNSGFGQFSGFERFEKTGASTWTVTGGAAFLETTINQGTLSIDPTGVLLSVHTLVDSEGTLNVNGGLLTLGADILPGGTLSGDGLVFVFSTDNILGDLTNQGVIAPGNSIGTLFTIANYVGDGGNLEIETDLNPIAPTADRLVIGGDVSGTTPVVIQNIGGTGLVTGKSNTDGLSVVQVAGDAAADSFQLPGGYAAVGPYRYELNAFAPGQSNANEADLRIGGQGPIDFWDYRLQSVVQANGTPVVVPQIPAYQALSPAALQYGWTVLDSLHERLGEIKHVTEIRDRPSYDETYESFFRARGLNGAFAGQDGPDFDQDLWFVQAGANLVGWDIRDTGDSLRLGMAFSYGQSQVGIEQPVVGDSSLNFKSPGLALTGTYQTASGAYIDTVLRGNHIDAEVDTAARGRVAQFDGWGGAASVETGMPFYIAERLILEPQAQLAYQRNWYGAVTDADGIPVDLHDSDGLRGRVGGRLQKTFANGSGAEQHLWSPYLSANVVHGFLGPGSVFAGGVGFDTDKSSTAMQYGTGLNAQLGQRWGLYSNASYIHGLSDGGIDHAWTGTGGLRFTF